MCERGSEGAVTYPQNSPYNPHFAQHFAQLNLTLPLILRMLIIVKVHMYALIYTKC